MRTTRKDRADAGETLIEVLLAVLVLGLGAVAILLAFTTSIIGSSEYRTLSTVDTVLRSAAESATAQIQAQPASAWACPTSPTSAANQVSFTVANGYALPAGYTSQPLSVQYWDPVAATFTSVCVANTAQLIQLTITYKGVNYSITFVVDDPQTRPISASGAATKLVFIGQPGSTISGSSIAPPPVVAVEDQFGNIVTTDLSPVQLSILAGSGTSGATLSGNCSGIEFYGVVTFSNCSISMTGNGYKLTAADGILTPATSAAFNILPAPASQLVFSKVPSGGQPVSANATSGPYQVQEQDLYGNPIAAGSAVTLNLATSSAGSTGIAPFYSLSSGGSAATGVTSVVIPSGSSTSPSFYYSDTVAGTPTLTASNPTLIDATTTITTTPGAAASLAYTTPPPAATSTGSRFTVVVAEEDAYGNVETADSSTSVTLTAPGGSGFNCSTRSPARLSGGSATFTNCSYSTSGSLYTLTATAGALTPATATTTVLGPATKDAYTTPPPALAGPGATFSVVVAEQDASGNTEAGDSSTLLSLHANNGGGGFACTVTPTRVTNGIATFTGCSYTIPSGTPYTLTASSGGLTSATATTTVVSSPSKLAYTTPPPVATGASTPFSVVVAEEDAFGNTVINDSTTTLSLAANNGGGGFACAVTPSTVTSGVATFSGCSYLTSSATAYTLTASSAGLTSATANTIVAGVATKLVYTTAPPASAVAGTPFTVVVAEQDTFSNTETTDSAAIVNLVANNGGGGFSCSVSPTHVTNGVATFTGCAYGTASASPYTLTASSGVLASATANTTVSVGAAFKLVYTTAPPAATAAGTTFTVAVTEEDASSNVELADSTTTLALGANNGGGGFSCTVTPSHVTSGVATYTGCRYTVASGSAFTLTASSAGLVSATATTTVSAGTATKLVYTTAPPAATTASATFTVVVAEQDTFSNTLTGDSATTLSLAANNGGGGFLCTTTPSHVTNGVATYTGCRYTVASGSAYTLTASSTGLTSATATTTVAAGTASKLVYTTPPPVATTAGSAFTVVVAEQDASSNTEVGDSSTTLNLAASSGGGGFSCTTTPTHVTNGVATYTGCTYTIASGSAYTLTASSAGLASATAATTVSAGTATKLVYTTAPPATIGATVPFTVVVAEQDVFSNTESGDSTTVLSLTANNGGGGFACTVSPTHVTNGVATYTGCTYTIASLTSYTLTAASAGLTSATATTHVLGVATTLVYTTPPPGAAVAGSTFTVVVAERDGVGNTETLDNSTTLSLAANNGGGGFTCSVRPAHVTAGIATYTGCSYTIASVTAYTLTASAAGLASATATTTVSAGTATKLVYTTAPPAATTAGTTFTVVVAEQDALSNTEVGDNATTLNLAANNGGGGFTCTVTPTHVTAGVATYTGCRYTVASASAYTLTASAAGLVSAAANTTVSAGTATKLVYTTAPPAATTAGTTFTVVVAEQDALSNTEVGDNATTLNLAANNGGGGFTCTVTPTHVTAGVATYTGCRYTVASASAYTLTASAAGLASATATTTVSAGTATKLVYTTSPPAATTAGTTFTVVVAEQDASSNTEVGDSATSVSLAANNGGGGFSCTTSPTHVTNGVATFTGCSYTTASGSAYTLTASSAGLASATATTTVTPGMATKLVYTTAPPATIAANTTFTVVVAEQDAFSNTETADSATLVALSATGGSGFSCTVTPTHVTNGVATYTGCRYTVASASTYTLTASSAGLTSATATTHVLGTASKLVYTTPPPGATTAGTTFSIVVAEEDSVGNTESLDNATTLALAANNGGGGFACTNTPTHVTAGVATYTGCAYTIASGSAYTLTASSAGLTSATATTSVTAGTPTKLVYTTAPPAATTAGSAFTVVVAEQDPYSNLESGDSTTSLGLAANNGGGGFSCTVTPTHVTNGVATFTGCRYTVASGSAFTLTASSAGLVSATASTTVSAGGASKLAYTTPPPASTPAGATFTVVVAEQDAFSNTLTGDSATALTLAATGGSGFACTTTPAHVTIGVATFTGCSYTVASGASYTLTASSGGLAPATATTTVSAGTATKLVYTTAPPASTTVGTTFSVVVAEQDAFNNLEAADSATALALAANHGGGGFSCSVSPTHVTGGIATFTGCSYTASAGSPYTLTASSSGLTGATATTTVTHGAASKVAFTTMPQIFETSTGSGTITVQAEDQFGNPVPAPAGGYSVALSTSSTHGSFAPTSPLTIAAGTSSASFLYHDTAAGTWTLTATVAALANPTVTQAETAVSNAASTTVAVSNQTPSPVTAGNTATYTVTLTNPTAFSTHDYAITSVSGLPQGATHSLSTTCVTISDFFGNNTSNVTLTVPTSTTTPNGTSTLAVVATAYNSTNATCSGTVTGTGQANGTLVVSAAATQLVFVQQPSTVAHNASIAPSITVLLVDGNFDAVASSGVPITLAIGTNPGVGTLSGGGPTNTAASGVATFSTTKISLAGSGYTLTASSPGLTGATSTAFNVT